MTVGENSITFGNYDPVPCASFEALKALPQLKWIRVKVRHVLEAMHQFNMGLHPAVINHLALLNTLCPLFRVK